MQNTRSKMWKNFTALSQDFHILRTDAPSPIVPSLKAAPVFLPRRLAAGPRTHSLNGGIIYKPAPCVLLGEAAKYEILSLAFLLRLVLHF